jgi:hypothetical protein
VTTQNGQPFNVAHPGSHVGLQSQNVKIDTAYIDSATLPGDVQLTASPDATPRAKFGVGVQNLEHGNPREARKLIWEAMMGKYVDSGVLFRWLVAMLSGRTVQQFSKDEISQLKRSQSLYPSTDGDAWGAGVRVIYRLLDSVLRPTAAKRRTSESEMQLVVKQVDALEPIQRDMLWPHLQLFLTGPLQDEVWRKELRLAQDGRRADGRTGRAWMFFQPIPADASLPSPQPERE